MIEFVLFILIKIRLLVASTFIFANRGHGLYMCSPTEIQKFTIASDVKEQISEMLCELYSPSIVMPEAPKQNFIVKFFASNSDVDSDQLCKFISFDFVRNQLNSYLVGEAAGKAPLGVVKKEDVNVNINQMRGKAESVGSVVSETRMVN
jgi:syntaxin-binding protein 5